MTREERMANRVLAKQGLVPPYDLDCLAQQYGELEYIQFPIKADGITIGIGELDSPKILINTDAPETRQRFTLAHEIGHIVIPWHTGTIVSHVDSEDDDFAYSIMETEANRFAAELLMPTSWLASEFISHDCIENYFKDVLKKTGVSRDAAFYKIFRSLDSPVVCMEVDFLSRKISCARSTSAPHIPKTTQIEKSIFPFESKFEQFAIEDKFYVSWRFTGVKIDESDERSWREILTIVMDETKLNGKLHSINALLASAFQKSKNLPIEEICATIIRRFSSRDDLAVITEHPLFEQYVIKRALELSQKSKK
ncbi:ImmA/IrrE family metallo-endopeptidase [Stutzerimonas zhaodongensis]|uniref:ImmA/IrrE family metallo-endopeptidase n=1 Tax=Stutzerimonas zhaodongensis TaxID=1176257 RepID=UPI0039EDF296